MITKYLNCIAEKLCSLVDVYGPKNISVPRCDGNVDVQSVDLNVGAYLLNQDKYAVVPVYDNANAVISGVVGSSIAGSVITIQTVGLGISNDTLLGYLIDWQTGHTDIILSGASSSFDFVSQPNATGLSKYEVKIYAITSSGNIILLFGIEYTWNGTTISQVTSNPINVNRSYTVTVGRALRSFCDNSPFGSAFTPNGTVYSLVGSFSVEPALIRDERFSSTDITLAGSTTVTVVTPAEEGSQNRLTGAIANAVTTVTSPSVVGTRDVTVYNSKNVTVAFEYTSSVNGTFKRVNIPANGTWSNTLKRDEYTNEGVYTAGRIVTAYGAAGAAGEININWTT